MLLLIDTEGNIIEHFTHKPESFDQEYAAEFPKYTYVRNDELPENFVNLENVRYINGSFDLSNAIDTSNNVQVVNEVPVSVTKRQGRQQLIIMGIIDQVQPAIDATADALERALVQSFWDDSTQYERLHPQMIQLGTAIGLTELELDQAFRDAALL